MKKRAKLLFTTLLIFFDGLMAGLAFYLAVRIWLATAGQNLGSFRDYWPIMLLQIASLLTVYFFSRLYHLQRATSRIDEFYSVAAATSVGTIVSFAATAFLFKEADYPRWMVVYAWVLTIFAVTIGRSLHRGLQRELQRRGYGEDRVLIVGTGEVGQMIQQKIQHSPGLGYKVAGFVANGASTREKIMDTPVLGHLEDLPRLIEELDISEVVIGLPDATRKELLAIISLCERGRVGIKIFPDVFQIMAREVNIGHLNGLPLLTVRDVALRGWRLALKRAVDIAGSMAALVLLSPLMLLTAILIKLDSAGPVFYVQERMGLDAKPFACLKFRSMRRDAEIQTGAVWAIKDDPRRTRIGALIRRFSIDELPQFVNVLMGDMSLVGPRPERPVFVEQFRRSIPRYMERHRERAGITGWAQVNGLRGDTSIIERTKYDLWYIENWSLWLDFKIIIRTIANLIFDRNAY
ncbi:MAG: undecaprenyl-phosphate glucose phosphotransferase [Chloroflexota bacterium]